MKNYFFFSLILLFSCKASSNNSKIKDTIVKSNNDVKIIKSKYIKDIELPFGFKRMKVNDSSFENYLRNISLKENNTVYLYNGEKKINQNAQFAVLNVSVGIKDLQQCADAIMRLRAEYLFLQKKYNEIVFTDNDKKRYQFNTPYTRSNFDNYLQKVFGMCGSKSLEMQLKTKKDLTKINIGDVFINGGFPGHAEIVVDVAENNNGERVFMLAQSYMPAQDIHILKNPNKDIITPWYYANEIGEYLYTPEYTFTKNQLKEW